MVNRWVANLLAVGLLCREIFSVWKIGFIDIKEFSSNSPTRCCALVI